MKIIIFGTGSSAQNLLASLNDRIEIICFLDNNSDQQGKIFNNCYVHSPNVLESLEYDYIIIASQYSLEITKQLLSLGVSFDRIIPYNFNRQNQVITQYYQIIFDKLITKSKKDSYKIALINYNYSNYNGYALYKYLPDFIEDKYEVELLEDKDIERLNQYDVICSSHFDGIYNKNFINIEMWHGFPLKKMGFLHEPTINSNFITYQKMRDQNTQLIISYSQLYTTIFNSCFPTREIGKYKITGMPKNDLLFEKGSLGKLERLVDQDLKNKKVIFYLPTWRKGKNNKKESGREWKNLFGFEDENETSLHKMLEHEDLFLIVKLHPFEAEEYQHSTIINHPRIFLLNDDMLFSNRLHLYELLPAANILITDYSSIYFDTLLIDLPVIFAPTDIDEYESERGFLIEPYESFTPGPVVKDFNQLYKSIVMVLTNDTFKNDREVLKKMVYKYTDNNSSLRTWREIDRMLDTAKGSE